MNDLINAIAAIIAEKYNYTIYLDELEVKEGFERPSFFIYFISKVSENINRLAYNSNVLVQIVYFSKLDKYQNIESKADQSNIIETLEQIFISKISIAFSSGCARIKQTMIDYTSDKDIFLQLNLDIVKSIDITENYELMQDIQLKQNRGGN